MSNLKGPPAHESRQCLLVTPWMINPVAERCFTIFVFMSGAVVFASIYGNIAQVCIATGAKTLHS